MVDLVETWGRGYMYVVLLLLLLCYEEWNAFLQSRVVYRGFRSARCGICREKESLLAKNKDRMI